MVVTAYQIFDATNASVFFVTKSPIGRNVMASPTRAAGGAQLEPHIQVQARLFGFVLRASFLPQQLHSDIGKPSAATAWSGDARALVLGRINPSRSFS